MRHNFGLHKGMCLLFHLLLGGGELIKYFKRISGGEGWHF
jgi:hypothetical protein